MSMSMRDGALILALAGCASADTAPSAVIDLDAPPELPRPRAEAGRPPVSGPSDARDEASPPVGPNPEAGPPRDTRAVDDGALAPAAGCSSARYCEGFETYAEGATPGAPWRAVVNPPGKMIVDGTKPHSGRGALHITIPAGDSGAAYLVQSMGQALPMPRNDLHGRAMVFFNKMPPRNAHFPLFEVKGVSSVRGNVNLRLSGLGINRSQPVFHFNHVWPSGETGKSSKAAIPGDRWVCIQWHYDGSDAGGGRPRNEARLWIDGAQVGEMTVSAGDRWNFATPWTVFQVGLRYFQRTPDNTELWIDDIALSGAPIPCPGTR